MFVAPAEVFSEFGPSRFLRKPATADALRVSRNLRRVRKQLRSECPAAPGVYGMIDAVGRLIYVGTSVRLRDRLVTYFQGDIVFQSNTVPQELLRRDRDARKEQRISCRTKWLVWEVVGHELLALLRELELIRRFQPEMNIRGRDGRRLQYLYLSAEDAPRFRVGAQLPKGCRHHWGPLAGNGHLVRVTDWLNRRFKLADCPERVPIHFADQQELFALGERPGCLRGEVNACLAPCVGLCSRSAYLAQIQQARDFLDGRSDEPLESLRGAIQAAADGRNFEYAARLRDALDDLERLCSRLVLQRRPQRHDFVYPVRRGGRRQWILVHAGNVVAARREPCTPASAQRWLARFDNLPRLSSEPLVDRDAGGARIVASWFHHRPEELSQTLPFDAAVNYCNRILQGEPPGATTS